MQAQINPGDAYMTDQPEEPVGRARGGLARAEKLSKERRVQIARQAAIARHGAKPPKASHKGNFKENFGVDAECYVLDDQYKTAVMTERGIGAALGLSKPGGKDFQRLVQRKYIASHLGADVLEKIMNPIEFQWIYPGAKQNSITIKGYGADILIDVCSAILAADASGSLRAQQKTLAIQARTIVNASAKSGITRLVYALAGYNPSAEEVINAFKMYVLEEAKKYEQEFPSELYMAWHRLYQIPVPVRGKPWHFKHLTLSHVYYPLAKSSGKVLTLLRAEKARDRDRQKKLFQFLTEIGTRALRIQLGRVLEMAESSTTKHEYEAKIAERFGGQQELQLIEPSSNERQPPF